MGSFLYWAAKFSTQQRRRTEVATRVPADETVESAEAYQARKEFSLPIPTELKLRLVEDWTLVTKQHKVGLAGVSGVTIPFCTLTLAASW
jgi:hypothetical protein